MSNLISRSELLRYMENTELSQFIDEINKGNDNYNSTPLYDYVKEMPTAYSVDEVVEELKLHSFEFGTDSIPAHYLRLNEAIEIVKQGGVSDDVCEWKSVKLNYEWKPSCEPNSTYNVCGVSWFKRCPYCGKKIKIVGD